MSELGTKLLLLLGGIGFSAGISLILIRLLAPVAARVGLIDQPGHRKIHERPVPLHGGISVGLAVLATLAAGLFALRLLQGLPGLTSHLASYPDWTGRLPGVLPELRVILLGMVGMAALGIWDDLRKKGLGYRPKFAVQFLIAAAVVAAGVKTEFLPGNVLDAVFSFFWIVGITNAFNLLDNMDGLSSGTAAIATAALLVLTVLQHQDYMAFFLAAILGANLGFLRFNFFSSGKVFLGDSGSLLNGFLLAVATIRASYLEVNSPTVAPVLIPVILLSVPIFDTLSVLVIRWREGRPLFVGDTRHLSHRLVELGMSRRQAVALIYLLNAGVSFGAILLPYLRWSGALVVLLQTAVLFALLVILMGVSNRRIARIRAGIARGTVPRTVTPKKGGPP